MPQEGDVDEMVSVSLDKLHEVAMETKDLRSQLAAANERADAAERERDIAKGILHEHETAMYDVIKLRATVDVLLDTNRRRTDQRTWLLSKMLSTGTTPRRWVFSNQFSMEGDTPLAALRAAMAAETRTKESSHD